MRSDAYPRRVSRIPSVDVLMGSSGGASMPAAADMERAVARIAGVQAVRVVTSGERVAEIHVLATRSRAAKQLVRDVQSVVLTNFGYEIDYRTVSVVQLEEEGLAPEKSVHSVPTPEPVVELPVRTARPVLVRVGSETSGFDSEVRVLVRTGGAEVEGVASGSASIGLRLVAQAAVDAIKTRLGSSGVDIEFAGIVPAGRETAALVLLKVLTGRGDHLVTGSAIVRRDPADAVAKAALDAVNRLLDAN